MVKGEFWKDDRCSEVLVSVQSGSRKVVKENQQEYDKISDHIGKYPVVLIAPEDSVIIREGSETRRRFFDGIISQLERPYLEALLQYTFALKNRNTLLKMFGETGDVDLLALESYDRLLIRAGNYIHSRRLTFLQQFLPVFRTYYAFLADHKEDTSIRYVSELHETEFETGLKKTRQKDLLLQRTNFGPHRDDFTFMLGPSEVKRLGSQGQQKSFVIALKLAQYSIIKEAKGFSPLLLLDDIFDKLDDFRIQKLLTLINNEQSGQLFITDARPGRTVSMLQELSIPSEVFNVSEGAIT
jgi:DNA replication and repair protein RecF